MVRNELLADEKESNSTTDIITNRQLQLELEEEDKVNSKETLHEHTETDSNCPVCYHIQGHDIEMVKINEFMYCESCHFYCSEYDLALILDEELVSTTPQMLRLLNRIKNGYA